MEALGFNKSCSIITPKVSSLFDLAYSKILSLEQQKRGHPKFSLSLKQLAKHFDLGQQRT